MTTNEN